MKFNKNEIKYMKNTGYSEPILVKNPHTGKHINLQPLFNLAFQLADDNSGTMKSIKSKIDNTVRLISTNRFLFNS